MKIFLTPILLTSLLITSLPVLAVDWTIDEAEGLGQPVATQKDNPIEMVGFATELAKTESPKAAIDLCISNMQKNPNSIATTMALGTKHLVKIQRGPAAVLLVRQAVPLFPQLAPDLVSITISHLGEEQAQIAPGCLNAALLLANGEAQKNIILQAALATVKNNPAATESLNQLATSFGMEANTP